MQSLDNDAWENILFGLRICGNKMMVEGKLREWKLYALNFAGSEDGLCVLWPVVVITF